MHGLVESGAGRARLLGTTAVCEGMELATKMVEWQVLLTKCHA